MSLRPADLPLGSLLIRAVIAGLIAGLVVSVFHLIATEPIIDYAVTLEEQLAPDHGMGEEPIVSRDVQRVGLVVGFLMYGITWSVLFGVAFYLLQRHLPLSTLWQRGLVLAAAAYWSVCLFPFLKYPANPPGVGEPESITYRQALYVSLLALSLVGTGVAIKLAQALQRRRQATWQPWVGALAFLGVFAAGVYLLMPANPDAVRIPRDVVSSFRALSLLGLTLFWLVMGAAFVFSVARLHPAPAR